MKAAEYAGQWTRRGRGLRLGVRWPGEAVRVDEVELSDCETGLGIRHVRQTAGGESAGAAPLWTRGSRTGRLMRDSWLLLHPSQV